MEEKTTKRLYMWMGIAVAIILCVVAGVFLLPRTPADAEERMVEPSVPPSLQTPAPTPSASPTATPAPTAYVLPLVPLWDEPSPSPTPGPPEASARGPALPNVEGRYDDTCKDLLAVGIQDGMATAILLVRIQGDTMTVLAIPCETVGTVYTLDRDYNVTAVNSRPLSAALRFGGPGGRQQLWNLVWAVKNTVGVCAAHFVALDLSCMEELTEQLGGLPGQHGTITPTRAGEILASSGTARAAGMADMGIGLVHAFQKTALWELPQLQKLTADKIRSGLSTRQMIAIALSFQRIEHITYEVLPTKELAGGMVPSYPDAEKILKKLYQ